MEIFFVISFLTGCVTVIDIFRRPTHEWEHIDRSRGHWIFLTILLSIFGTWAHCGYRVRNTCIAAFWIIGTRVRR